VGFFVDFFYVFVLFCFVFCFVFVLGFCSFVVSRYNDAIKTYIYIISLDMFRQIDIKYKCTKIR